MFLPSQLAPPTTETAGYFETSTSVLAEWLAKGLGPLWSRRTSSAATLDELLELLRPQAPLSRYLLLPNGNWSVLLNNGPLGTDVGTLPWHATKELGCRVVQARASAGRWPATILAVYDPRAVNDPFFCRRTIVAANDGGRWEFSETGERFAFEDTRAYGRRLVRNRFTPQMLARYLSALGVPADDKPNPSSAFLVELSR